VAQSAGDSGLSALPGAARPLHAGPTPPPEEKDTLLVTTDALLSRPPVTRPDVRTAAELAACLRRFLNTTADEQTMRRAAAALRSWDARRGTPGGAARHAAQRGGSRRPAELFSAAVKDHHVVG